MGQSLSKRGKMFRFFGNQRYFKLFFDLNGKNLHELSKKHGTISHLSVVTDQLSREGLIIKERIGREVELKLTPEGEEFKKILISFYEFSKKQLKVADENERKN